MLRDRASLTDRTPQCADESLLVGERRPHNPDRHSTGEAWARSGGSPSPTSQDPGTQPLAWPLAESGSAVEEDEDTGFYGAACRVIR